MSSFKYALIVIGGCAFLAVSIFLIGYHDGREAERAKYERELYSVDTVPDMLSSDLAPSIDMKPKAADVIEETGSPDLAPYSIHWFQIQYGGGLSSSWRAYLYVPFGMGEAVKCKLESLIFVDGVVIRNSMLYRNPKDDRLEVELSQRANKAHTERLEAMLPGIIDAAKRGL